MKLEFSYLSGKVKYRIIVIINLLIIVLLFSLNLITNNDFFFNFSLFMCFWLIIFLIVFFIRKAVFKQLTDENKFSIIILAK